MRTITKLTIMVALLAILAGCVSGPGRNPLTGAIDTDYCYVGMTERQAVETFGNPISINRSDGAYGARSQFVYGQGVNRAYLYFEDYRLTSWQH